MAHHRVSKTLASLGSPFRPHVILLILLALSAPLALATEPPKLMLAETYRQGLNTSDYLVSEKLDGIRARWDGKQLISRGGHMFAAPVWFIKDFPSTPLDGELWMGRGHYEATSSIVRKNDPHEGWENIRLMIFDVPEHGGPFSERVKEMSRLTTLVNSPYLAMIDQHTFLNETTLREHLETVLAQGGEGLMLHRKAALYARGRSHDLLKFKPFSDAEATVIGYRPGKGKYEGKIGSLKVQTEEGIVFYIGTGLSDAQRDHPPPINRQITFRHQGFTKNGIPRFPVFLRIRSEQPDEKSTPFSQERENPVLSPGFEESLIN